MLQLIKMLGHNCVTRTETGGGIRGCHNSSFLFAPPDTLEQLKLDQLVRLGGGRLAPTRKARQHADDACRSALNGEAAFVKVTRLFFQTLVHNFHYNLLMSGFTNFMLAPRVSL